MNTIALYMTLSLSALQTAVDTQSHDQQVKHLATTSLKAELTHSFSFTIKTDTLLIPMLVDQPTTAIKATAKADTQPTAVVSSRLSD